MIEEIKKGVPLICTHSKNAKLTKGNDYECLDVPQNEDNNKVKVMDDAGRVGTFYKSRFRIKNETDIKNDMNEK